MRGNRRESGVAWSGPTRGSEGNVVVFGPGRHRLFGAQEAEARAYEVEAVASPAVRLVGALADAAAGNDQVTLRNALGDVVAVLSGKLSPGREIATA